jgi:predicted DNA-binding transcriptional regulator AlpA
MYADSCTSVNPRYLKEIDPVIVEKHYSPRELAELSGIREGTLAAWRHRSKKELDAPACGPRFVKLGRCVRYPASAVREFLSQREHVATPAGK